MPAFGQLMARISQEAMRRKITRNRDNLKYLGIYDMLVQDYMIYRMATLYAYQMPKQMLKTAATVCRPWWR